MESDLQHHHHFIHDHHQHQQHHQKQMNSGLMRYQSAPSSYFTGFLDREFCEEFLNRPTSPETERIFARFLANSGGNTENMSNQNFAPIKPDSPVREAAAQVTQQPQIMASVNNNETRLHQQQQQQQQQRNYHSASQSFYQNQSRPPLPDQNTGSSMDYRMATSMGMERLTQMKSTNGGNNSNLVRHSSSPAGLFSNINIEMENASRPPPPSGRMSTIAEIGNKNMGENSPDNGGFGETRSNNYVSGFSIGSWDAKRLTDDDRSLSGLNASETQNADAGDPPPPMLSHHLSLPNTSAELSAIEKFLQLQDSVPCKIRAKRGCATHPRSIAERVRRTRISERMRKLQDLVPNMDKQTNTADMLDLAVDYIKDLQRQVKTLSENRARCTCTSKKQP